MATDRILPPRPEQVKARDAKTDAAAERVRQREIEWQELRRSIRAGAVAQVVVASALILAICYVAKLVLVTLMVSVLLAFVLEPVVSGLQRLRIHRSLGSLVAVLLLLGVAYGASYFFYNRAINFAQQLPKYEEKFRGVLAHLKQQTRHIEETTRKVMPGSDQSTGKKPVPVKVQNSSSGNIITNNLGTVTEVALTVAFIPFLVYFMLSWQEHARTKTVQLFRPEHRSTAYVTLGQISLMMRSFIAGNFIIGLFMGAFSVAVFGILHLPYFYFLGFISGFLSLVPYLGVILAILPPVAAGAGVLSGAGLIIIAVTELGLHVFSLNVLYPKVIGSRLQLNPLVVTIALLAWGWIWGAMGLILAVPMMGAIKIICDHVPSLRPIGEWMSE